MHRQINYSQNDKIPDMSMLTNPLPNKPQILQPPRKKAFEDIVGKEENDGYQHFLLFPQCFLKYH